MRTPRGGLTEDATSDGRSDSGAGRAASDAAPRAGLGRATQPITFVRWAVVLMFVGAGCAKLAGLPSMIALFNAVGFGQWFRYVIGAGELTGAALLAIPRTVTLGGLVLGVLMIGAAGTEMFILRRLPISSSVTLVVLAVVLAHELRPSR